MSELAFAGVRVHYEDTGGSGTPVLFVHAFPLQAAMWGPQIAALGDRWRAIAPDLQGFGRSSAPEDPSAYSMDVYADHLCSLLDDLGVRRAAVVGLSMGGYVAFALLRRRPEAVSALVLADTRAEADTPEGAQKRTSQQELVRERGTAPLIEDLLGVLLAPDTHARKPDVVERVRALMDNPAAGVIGALEALKGRPDSTDLLPTIEVPTLVMVGEHDAITPGDAARRLVDGIPGARLVTIPAAGHLSNLEAPEAFNGALAEFLGRL